MHKVRPGPWAAVSTGSHIQQPVHAGLMTGVSVCAGHTVEVVPIVDGYGYPNLVQRLPVGGREVTAALLSTLSARGAVLSPEQDFAAVNALKERACFVAPDLQRETQVRCVLGFPRTAGPEHSCSCAAGRGDYVAPSELHAAGRAQRQRGSCTLHGARGPILACARVQRQPRVVGPGLCRDPGRAGLLFLTPQTPF